MSSGPGRRGPRRAAMLAALVVVAAGAAFGQETGATEPRPRSLEVTPWAGLDFGGEVFDPVDAVERSFEATPAYGVAISYPFTENWRVEVLYSRQPTSIEGGVRPSLNVTVERYLAGVQEEVGENENVRWIGSIWVGVTRFVPGLAGFGSETQFGAGLGLGVKTFLARNLGLRFEARGFFTNVNSQAGAFCGSNGCLFAFSASGIWQGDVSAGVIVAF